MLSFYDTPWYPMMLVGRTGSEIPKEIVEADSIITKEISGLSLITQEVNGDSIITKELDANSTVIP